MCLFLIGCGGSGGGGGNEPPPPGDTGQNIAEAPPGFYNGTVDSFPSDLTCTLEVKEDPQNPGHPSGVVILTPQNSSSGIPGTLTKVGGLWRLDCWGVPNQVVTIQEFNTVYRILAQKGDGSIYINVAKAKGGN